MASLPSRIEVQVGDTYESLKIKREQLLNGPNPPTAVPSDQDLFHAALRVRILQDIACIHAQIENKDDTDVSETTQDFSDLAEEYKHSIHQIQLLQSKIGLKDPVVGSLLPEGSESLDILDIPAITRINFYRGGLGRPVLENIPKAIRFDERIKLDREDVTVYHVSEIRRALELCQKVHRALEVEASECRIALLQHIQESDNDIDLSSIMSRIGMKPGNGDNDVVSSISSPITETSIHQDKDEPILLAPTSEKDHATEPVATSKKKRRRVRGRNRRNKKASLNRGESQHPVVSVEDPAVSREDLSTSIEGPEGSFGDPAVLVEDPAVSTEGPAASAEEHTSIAEDIGNLALSNAALPTNPVFRPTTSGSNIIARLPPTGPRPVDTRSRELLISRGETLVEAVDPTHARALESSLAQVTTSSSNNELGEGHAQTENSEMDERKKLVKQAKNRKKKAWQRRRRGMKSKMKEANSSVNAPRSLSPVRDTCLPSPLVAGIEIPKKNFLEEQQPQSAPPVPLECPSTTTVDGPSQNNEWNRPASAAAHLPQIQNTNSAFEYVAVGSAAGSPHISVWEDENNEDQVCGSHPACCYHPRHFPHRSCCCTHHPGDCCNCAGSNGAALSLSRSEVVVGDQFSIPVESVASLQSPIPGQSSVAANFAVPIRLFVPLRISLSAELGVFTEHSPPLAQVSVPVQFLVPMTFVVPSEPSGMQKTADQFAEPASGSRGHRYWG